MSGSSEDESSGGNSSDEDSGDESVSESGSSSDSGSGDEGGSESDSDSSSGSGSGSSSGEDDDNGSTSASGGEDSGDSEEEEEEDEGSTKEKRLARKREDFEKMQEISAHMDNIVQRLSTFFPRGDKASEKDTNTSPDPPVAPDLPALPLSPPNMAADRPVSARVITMDRAVSARKLTTDRAVSVASGMHFDDNLSASTASNSRHEDQQNTRNRRREARKEQGAASRRPSSPDADWTGRDRTGPERRVGTRDDFQAEEPPAAQQDRTEAWQRNETHTNNADMGLGPQREPGGGQRRSRVSPGSPAAELGVESAHERLLWDDLRESLEGAAGGERIPARSTWARGVTVEKTKEERDREQRRRRLIDEAISVLLEGDNSSSGGGSSSDDERLKDGAL